MTILEAMKKLRDLLYEDDDIIDQDTLFEAQDLADQIVEVMERQVAKHNNKEVK